MQHGIMGNMVGIKRLNDHFQYRQMYNHIGTYLRKKLKPEVISL